MAPPQETTIGLLGTGKIGSAVISGFCSANGWQPRHVTVSARTKSKADALVAHFPERISIGATNQEIVDNSDVIFIGLLPHVAKEVVSFVYVCMCVWVPGTVLICMLVFL